jgi:uncharacterized RDD family membrane protein YckC
MEYIVRVNDKEYGPVTEDILREWVEDGRVICDTKVRNSMMKVWKNAGEFPFLGTAFVKQNKKFNASVSASVSHTGSETQVLKVSNPLIVEGRKDTNKSSEFKNRLLPDRADISLRLKAGVIDLAVIVFIFILSFLFGTYFIFKYGANPNFAAYASFVLWFLLTLLYFGGCIGVFAQTLGMWYYGIMLVRDGDDAEEVYLLRAYIYALLILIIGIFSPVFNFISGRKRSLHDFLTDTQVVKISARKNAIHLPPDC